MENHKIENLDINTLLARKLCGSLGFMYLVTKNTGIGRMVNSSALQNFLDSSSFHHPKELYEFLSGIISNTAARKII